MEYNLNVGDIVSIKSNPNMVGFVTGLAPAQGVFWVIWLDTGIKVIYSNRDFNLMFNLIARV